MEREGIKKEQEEEKESCVFAVRLYYQLYSFLNSFFKNLKPIEFCSFCKEGI